MRRDYFDDRSPDETKAPGRWDWRPSPAPAPYGPLPGQAPPPESPPPFRTPDFRRARGPRLKKGALRTFALSLTLILLLSGAGVCYRLSQGDTAEDFLPQQPWGGVLPESPMWSDWTQSLPATTVPRAPLERRDLSLTAPSAESLTPQEIYQRVSPAVVGVRAFVTQGMALGTGVVMSTDGYLITNAHVIAGAQRLEAVFADGRRLDALLVGYDGGTDLAVLKVDSPLPLPCAVFGDSSHLTVGESAYAIGNPLGEELRGTMTDGIISAIDRPVSTDQGSMTLIQTTAALNPGNSGGALVNAAGQVVGITNMKMASPLQPIEALGFAIPTTLVKPVVEQIMATGAYAGLPMLGITVQNHYDPDGFPDGALVSGVLQDADACGKLWAGDLIVAAAGESVTCSDDLLRVKNALLVGDSLTLQVRPGAPNAPAEEVTITLMAAADLAGSPSSTEERGLPQG